MKDKKISYYAYYSTVKEEYALEALEECATEADDLHEQLEAANERIAELEAELSEVNYLNNGHALEAKEWEELYCKLEAIICQRDFDPAALVKPLEWKNGSQYFDDGIYLHCNASAPYAFLDFTSIEPTSEGALRLTGEGETPQKCISELQEKANKLFKNLCRDHFTEASKIVEKGDAQ